MAIKRGCGVIVLNDLHQILMGQRVKAKKHEVAMQWCIPGGGIEVDEEPVLGAMRELQEETSLEAFAFEAIKICNIEQLIGTTLCKDYTYLITGYTGEVKDNPEEMINYKWFELSEILALTSEEKLFPATLVSIANYINYINHGGEI